MTLSAVCGLHCVAAPWLAGAAASLPLGWLFREQTEGFLLTVTATAGLVSLAPAYLRRHRRKRCLGLFVLGAAGIAAAKLAPLGESTEPWAVAASAAAIAAAHLLNLRLCRQCRHCQDTGEPCGRERTVASRSLGR